MRIIIHPGAHGAGAHGFQAYLERNRDRLGRAGVAVWTAPDLRAGIVSGLSGRGPGAARRLQRSHGRIRMALADLAQAGRHTLVLSDPGLMGSARGNLDTHLLYPHLPDRLARLLPGFTGHSVTLGVEIGTYEDYWTSALGDAVRRGAALPGAAVLDHLTTQPRRWRSLLRKIAGSLPGHALLVWSAERYADRKGPLMRRLVGPLPEGMEEAEAWPPRDLTQAELAGILRDRGERVPLPGDAMDRWRPFDGDRAALLRAEYRADLAWLRAGADDLATYIDGQPMPAPRPDRAEITFKSVRRAPPLATTGGPRDDIQERLG